MKDRCAICKQLYQPHAMRKIEKWQKKRGYKNFESAVDALLKIAEQYYDETSTKPKGHQVSLDVTSTAEIGKFQKGKISNERIKG